MSGPRIRRVAPVIVLIAVLAIVAASCTPATQPPQPQRDFHIRANTLHVIQDNNDCFGPCTFDEPYLINLDFRVWFNHPGSAGSFVVDDVSNELQCPGGPNGGIFGVNGNISCSSGESAPVPAVMGYNVFPNLKSVDVLDIALGRQPEVAGDVSFAYEEDQIFGSGNVADTVASFANVLKNVLNSTVAVGKLPTDANAAASLLTGVIGDVFLSFIGNTLLGLLSGLGNADDLIGVAPIIGVGISGTLAQLTNVAGLNNTPVLNGRVFTFSGGNTTITYTGQQVGPITLGANDTRYSVDWSVF